MAGHVQPIRVRDNARSEMRERHMSYSKPRVVHELHNFRADATEMNDEQFTERHGHGFLLHAGDLGVVSEDISEHDTLEMTADQAQKRRGQYLVFPLGHYSEYRTVRVGSAAHNDVMIEHASIAPAHAVFVCEAGAAVSLWRTAKEHETSYHGQPSPLYDTQVPEKQILTSGSPLQIGGVSLVYLSSPAFAALVRQLLG